MRNYIQPGHAITLAAPYDVVSGAGLLVGSIFGVASHDALSGAEVETQLTGVVDLAKVAQSGLDRRRQGLLGQHGEARHQRRLGQHARRRRSACRRSGCRRDRWPGSAQRRLLSDDRLRRPRGPALRRSEPRARCNLGAGGGGAGLGPRGRPAGRRSHRVRRRAALVGDDALRPPRRRGREPAAGGPDRRSTARPSSCRASRCGTVSG